MCEREGVGDGKCINGRFTGVRQSVPNRYYQYVIHSLHYTNRTVLSLTKVTGLAFGLSVGLRKARGASRSLATSLVHTIDINPHEPQLTGVELTKVRLKLRS